MTDEVLGIFKTISEEVVPQADTLRELDAKIGDGDLGITVTRGMEAVIAGLKELEGTPVSNQLARSGMAFNRAAASTFGVLFATAMMRGGAAVKDHEDVGASDVAAIGQAAMKGLMDRGKAKIGGRIIFTRIDRGCSGCLRGRDNCDHRDAVEGIARRMDGRAVYRGAGSGCHRGAVHAAGSTELGQCEQRTAGERWALKSDRGIIAHRVDPI